MTLPLADVRILAVEQFGAGPWGTLQLADLGADVVKLEDPASAGDVGRYVPPYQTGEDSLFFEAFNRGKRSISLDLVDDRLTSLWIGYDETFKVHTAEEFVKLISQSLGVNGNWSSYRSKGQQLRCADFQMIVTTVAGGPSFRMLDVGAEDLVAERRQAKEEQDAVAEANASGESTEAPPAELVADKDSKTYYPNGCTPSKEIAEKNKVVFKTAADAEKAGFKAAKNCH